jgi:minor extracellular serine protease Vpr
MIDNDGHGTHVAGTAAGRNAVYGGVAPDANIIVVSYDSSLDLGSGYADTIFSTNICQAAYYVFEKASELGMPAVVNLSLGTHIGPHDGTSLFEECLSGLVNGAAGRAIVAAAGNEYSDDAYYTGIHTGFEVENSTAATNFVIRKPSQDRVYYIDIWGTQGSDLSIGIAMHNGRPSGSPKDFSEFTAPGETDDGSFLDGKIRYKINASETSSALNGKPHIGIRITIDPSITNPKDYSFDLVARGTGSFDAWLFPDKPAKTIQFTSVSGDISGDWNYVAGDSRMSVAMPSTSPEIISVGGYTSRNRWNGGPGCCEVAYAVGDILNFSSSGPSANASATGFKPDIAAPGGMIASALSSAVSPNSLLILEDGKHVLQAGTSMATPFVTGTIALMFSADPNYTSNDVKRYIIESAYSDDFTGEVPNARWGNGKLDVLRALEFAINGGSSGSFDSNESLSEPENAGGGSSCQLIIGETSGGCMAYAILAAIALITISIRRRKSFQRIG